MTKPNVGTKPRALHLREYRVQDINGLEVSRSRGLDAFGLTAAIGAALNVIGLIFLAGLAGDFGAYSFFSVSAPFFGFLVFASVIVGATAVLMLMKASGEIKVVGPRDAQTLTKTADLPKLFVLIMLFLIFGIFIGFALIIDVQARGKLAGEQ